MDPITTAVVAALPALASDLMKASIKDAYLALKAVIRRKWGESSAIVKSVDNLEADPKSNGKAMVLAEDVSKVNATSDTEVMQALAALLDELQKEGVGRKELTKIAVNISGGAVQGVVGSSNVSVGSMNFGASNGRRG
jgi:hypothetical protein